MRIIVRFTSVVGLLLACTCCALTEQAFAQEPLIPDARKVGEWRTHLPNDRPTDVTTCAAFTAWRTPGSVVLRFSESGELRRLDKANVLTQADPKFVACNPFAEQQLLVIYEDGAIDVLRADKVQRYTNAIAERDIFGRRGINGVSFVSATEAIISTDFGYLLFDPERGVFLEDIRFQSGINDAAVQGNDLYLASNRGLLYIANYRQALLRDTTRYITLSEELTGLPNTRVRTVETFGSEVFAGYDTGLYAVAAGATSARTFQVYDGCSSIRSLQANESALIATYGSICGPDFIGTSTDGSGFLGIPTDCSPRILDAVLQADGTVALASESEGVGLCITSNSSTTASCECSQFNGPKSVQTYAIDARNGTVAVAAGGLDPRAGYTFNFNGFYVLRDGNWSNYNGSNTEALKNDGTPTQLALADFVTVAVTADTTVYAGAYFEGLIELEPNGTATRFDERNSSLREHLLDPNRVRIGGLDLDDNGNLWIANTGTRNAISVREPDGTFHSFDISACGRGRELQIVADAQSRVVYVIDFLGGVIAFSYGSDFEDQSDDECRAFGINDNLPETDVRSLMLDRDGVLWIGTTNGIAKLNCGSDPFANTCEANRPSSEVDGIRGFFFDDEIIQAMDTDGGNRKWIGTSNGLFLLDARTDAQLAFYTQNNSPLIDNKINALSYDDETGLLWIGTDAGLMSLQTESTGSEDFFFEGVTVFPQPVRPEYEGPISIRGLATNADVKITDVAGRLVYETNAIGGQANWDGFDYTGRRPASGVYLIWSTASKAFDKPATVVGKIALIR